MCVIARDTLKQSGAAYRQPEGSRDSCWVTCPPRIPFRRGGIHPPLSRHQDLPCPYIKTSHPFEVATPTQHDVFQSPRVRRNDSEQEEKKNCFPVNPSFIYPMFSSKIYLLFDVED